MFGLTLMGLIWYCAMLWNPLFPQDHYSKVVFDKNGKLIAASISAEEQWHFKPSAELPDKYKKALLVFEDKRFYRHIGFDLKALLRATRLNVKHKRIVSGGSTISMQTIRLHQRNPKRSVWNKVLEIILATRLEIKHSKRDILQLYASHAPFGGNVIGIDAACWRYFNKSPEQISWAEASLLAVLPNSPGLIHTERNRDKLEQKRNALLQRLLENGVIDELSYEGALLEEIPRRPAKLNQSASHFMHFASERKNQSLIHSTIDANIQEKCLQIAETEGNKLKANFIDNMAILVLDIEEETVLAYVGNLKNTGYDNHEFTDMVQAQRSTGSILKPFLYTAALGDGLITEKSFLPDYPFSIGGFTTENYNKDHTGLIAANTALQRSLNIPFSKLLQDYGIEKFRLLCQALELKGIDKTSSYYGIPLILGGAESSLWDLTHAYASMAKILNTYNANDGYYHQEGIYRSRIQKNTSIKEKDLVANPALFRAENIWTTFEQLKELKRPNEEGEWKLFSHNVPIAWKTGTSNGFKDAWAIGVNGKYAVGIWVGNSDGEGRPGIIGSKAAAPIFFRVIHSLNGHRRFEQPIDDMVKMATCKLSGELANEFCPKDSTYLSRNSSFLRQCNYHREIFITENESFRVQKNCYEGEIKKTTELNIPTHIAYFYKQTQLYSPPLPWHPSCQNRDDSKLKIIYPEKNIQIYQPRVGENERNQFVLKAHHTDDKAQLMWHLDDIFLGSTQNIHEISVLLKKGTHRLLVLDENGNQDICSFEILQ